MEHILDKIWEYLFFCIRTGAETLAGLLSHLHFLGPLPIIALLAIITVAITKLLKRYIRTKRLVELEKDFHYWLALREEAMHCEDREKGNRLAKNIDQAKLNKAYYDYFFEGLLLSLITFYLPVLSMASFLNEYYRPERLNEIFGRSCVMEIGTVDPIQIGALFCFIMAVIVINIGIFFFKFLKNRSRKKLQNNQSDTILFNRSGANDCA